MSLSMAAHDRCIDLDHEDQAPCAECSEYVFNVELKAQTEGLRAENERLLKASAEARELLTEAIEDEDFQWAYSADQSMTGPALLGTLTRALDALARAALAEEKS